MRKTRLFLLTVIASMSFSVTACAKENTPVAATEVASTETASTETATEVVPSETATVPTTEVESETTTEVATSTEAEPSTEAYEGTDATVDGEVTYEDGFAVLAGDYIVTDEELKSLPANEWAQIKRTYKFLCRMDATLPTAPCDKTIGTIYMRYSNEQLLDLLNQDFGKAYDLIEKCGLDVTTDEGKELKAATMRTEAGTITNFDSFHDAYMDIIDYATEVRRNVGITKTAMNNAIEAGDAESGQKNLDLCVLYSDVATALEEFIDFYKMAYDEVREG